jgi:LPS export ABC transporter protein LptC
MKFHGKEKDVKISKAPTKIEDFTISHRELKQIKWTLSSKLATMNENSDEILLDIVTIKIFAGNGIIIEGKEGLYHQQNKTMLLKNPVLVTTKDYQLSTNSLFWNGFDKTVKTDDDIHLKGAKIDLTGKGLLVNFNDDTVVVNKNVKALVNR